MVRTKPESRRCVNCGKATVFEDSCDHFCPTCKPRAINVEALAALAVHTLSRASSRDIGVLLLDPELPRLPAAMRGEILRLAAERLARLARLLR